MPRQDFPLAAAGNYRVYTDSQNFVLVHAASAIEALQSSGMANVCKIERDSIDLMRVFSPNDWTSGAPAKEEQAPVAAAPAPQNEAATGSEQAKETVEVPLSNEEVGKLLNN